MDTKHINLIFGLTLLRIANHTSLMSVIACDALMEEYNSTWFFYYMFHIYKWDQQIHCANMSMLFGPYLTK